MLNVDPKLSKAFELIKLTCNIGHLHSPLDEARIVSILQLLRANNVPISEDSAVHHLRSEWAADRVTDDGLENTIRFIRYTIRVLEADEYARNNPSWDYGTYTYLCSK